MQIKINKPINIFFVTLFLLSFTFPRFAQAQGNELTEEVAQKIVKGPMDINKTISVIPLSPSDSDEADFAHTLTETIQTAIEQTKRFIMVDRMDLVKVLDIKIDQEVNSQEYQEWEKVSDSHLVTAGRRLGIEYIFTGRLSSVATPILISGGYGCKFTYTVKAISVETGRIFVSQSFNAGLKKKDRIMGKNSKREAMIAALEQVMEPVKKFIDQNFPLEVPFFKIKDLTKKGQPKTIVINGGITNGLRSGQKLDISIKGDGDYREKIGEVEIVEIEAKYAVCKIRKGAGKIKSQSLDDPTKIIARSIAYKRKGIF